MSSRISSQIMRSNSRKIALRARANQRKNEINFSNLRAPLKSFHFSDNFTKTMILVTILILIAFSLYAALA